MVHQPDGGRGLATQWAPCPPGEFDRLSARLGKRRRRRAFLRRAVGTAAVSLAAGGLWLTLRSTAPRESTSSGETPDLIFAGVSCTEVRGLAHAYAMGRLDLKRCDQIRRHVGQCPHCGPLFRSMGLES